ncbi:hypothetical protein EYF80_042916 [Liparis tanakae]|uniref:Uncharacterized protein n=1 Tax=Liparis tanakae TaxID=230148 RepID=A0A4Z2G161_9TELE|nr:hypothetical protein EYF80_042916 [Liparis tanakae]
MHTEGGGGCGVADVADVAVVAVVVMVAVVMVAVVVVAGSISIDIGTCPPQWAHASSTSPPGLDPLAYPVLRVKASHEASQTQDTGHRTQDTGHRTQDTVH